MRLVSGDTRWGRKQSGGMEGKTVAKCGCVVFGDSEGGGGGDDDVKEQPQK